MINVRSETAATKPAFRKSLRDRRCLVLADGFYDWKREGSQKQPYYITLKSGDPFAFAGLWDHWVPADGDPLERCTILTATPNAVLQPIHDRMPVILPSDAYGVWLDPGVRDVEPVQALLTPYPADAMMAYPVSTRVNSPAADAPDLTEPLAPVSALTTPFSPEKHAHANCHDPVLGTWRSLPDQVRGLHFALDE